MFCAISLFSIPSFQTFQTGPQGFYAKRFSCHQINLVIKTLSSGVIQRVCRGFFGHWISSVLDTGLYATGLRRGESPKTISNNNIQNTRPIQRLGSVTVKWLNIHSTSSPTTGPKKESFLQMSFQERGYSYLCCVSQTTQNRSPI